MMGISWGGIASLQAATRQPPALKAIIPVGASVDRYYDDGGYLVGGYPGQGLGWGAVMFGYCIRPPDPAVVGETWHAMWRERLEGTPMFLKSWLEHQLRDETWVQGSVCERYDQIRIPVLAVSGWNDCWPNTVLLYSRTSMLHVGVFRERGVMCTQILAALDRGLTSLALHWPGGAGGFATKTTV